MPTTADEGKMLDRIESLVEMKEALVNCYTDNRGWDTVAALKQVTRIEERVAQIKEDILLWKRLVKDGQ